MDTMKIPVQLHERRITANGIHLRLLDSEATEKPPLLLLHGIYDRAECWQPVADALAGHFRLIMPDLRGHYRSDRPANGYALSDYAADAIGLLDALEIARADVLGHSLGALIAMKLACMAPQRVRDVVLEDPPSEIGDDTRTWLGALLTAKNGTEQQTYVALQGIHPGQSDEQWRREVEWLRSTADGPFLALGVEDEMSTERFAETVGQIIHPLLLLQADPKQGGALSMVAARSAMTAHGRCQLVQFHDTGHTIHRERPTEFVAAVAEFLAEP